MEWWRVCWGVYQVPLGFLWVTPLYERGQPLRPYFPVGEGSVREVTVSGNPAVELGFLYSAALLVWG